MSAPKFYHNLIRLGDRILYYMQQFYLDASIANPPDPQESLTGLDERLVFFLTRGYRFA